MLKQGAKIKYNKARGADSLGDHWAKTQNIAIKEYPANWTLYGKSAGLKRNKKMAKEADCGIAFWDGVSTGTQHMIKELRERQIPVLIYNYKAKTSSYLYYSDKR